MPHNLTDDKSMVVQVMAITAITWTSVDQDLQRHMVSLGPNEWTHLSLDKMAVISHTIFQMHFCEWKFLYFDYNVTEVCCESPIDNNPALV